MVPAIAITMPMKTARITISIAVNAYGSGVRLVRKNERRRAGRGHGSGVEEPGKIEPLANFLEAVRVAGLGMDHHVHAEDQALSRPAPIGIDQELRDDDSAAGVQSL